MKIVSFIPIKLNNQRLPGKNLLLLNGRPLCDYIFDTVCNVPEIDERYIYCRLYRLIDHNMNHDIRIYALAFTRTIITQYLEVSPSLISKVTDVVNEEVELWCDRLLETVYPMEWYKELLGIWIAEHEGALFVLTKLNNRGVKDVFVFCVDGLTSFPDAIKGVFPKAA